MPPLDVKKVPKHNYHTRARTYELHSINCQIEEAVN